jgi:tetratricopeptide (TPR) repeat protein
VLAHRAVVECARGQWEAAIADATQALRREPQSMPALRSRARAQLERGHLDAARADLDAALALRPHDAVCLALRARWHRSRGDLPAALAEAARAVQRDADSAEAYLERARIRAELGESERAVRDCTTALLLHRDPAALALRARLHLSLGNPAAARADVEEALTLPGAARTGARHTLAWLLATAPDDAQRDGPRALRLARESIHEDGAEDLAAFDALAAALAATGDFAGAVDMAQLVLEATPIRDATALAARLDRRAAYRRGEAWRVP